MFLIQKQKRDFPSALICILLTCCVLLAASGVTFGLYTVRQLNQIKARIIYNEKIINDLQTSLTFGQVQVGKSQINSFISYVFIIELCGKRASKLVES